MERPIDRYGDTLARWTTEELETLAAQGWTLVQAVPIVDELAWRAAQDATQSD